MTLAEAQAVVDEWIQTIGVRYFDEMTNLAVLTEEVGELARLFSRIYGEQSFKVQPTKTHNELLSEEMADVLFVLICLANQTGVDLTQALAESLRKKTQRDSDRHKSNEKLQ